MSYIGEARGFRKAAETLRRELREHGFSYTAEKRAALVKAIESYDNEARFCWDMAREEFHNNEKQEDGK